MAMTEFKVKHDLAPSGLGCSCRPCGSWCARAAWTCTAPEWWPRRAGSWAIRRWWRGSRRRSPAGCTGEAGDERTLAQLRTDLAVDLLLGRRDRRLHRRVRPPGRGPAGHPDSTLVPDADRPRPVVRQVVADFGTCYVTGCAVPAEACDLDHRVRAPDRATSTENLGPGCRGHRTAKHAPASGCSPVRTGPWPSPPPPAGCGTRCSRPTSRSATPGARRRCGAAGHRRRAPRRPVLRRPRTRPVHRHRLRLREQEQQAWADYRASYPDATDADIAGWVHDDDPRAPTPPRSWARASP